MAQRVEIWLEEASFAAVTRSGYAFFYICCVATVTDPFASSPYFFFTFRDS